MRVLLLPSAVLLVFACSTTDQVTHDGGQVGDGGADTSSPIDSGSDTSIQDSSVADASDASKLGTVCNTDQDCGPNEACPGIYELAGDAVAVCKKASASVDGCGASPPTVTIALNQVVYVDYDFSASTRSEHLNDSSTCTDPPSSKVDQVFVLHVSSAGTLNFWSNFSSVGVGAGSSCPGTCSFTGAFSTTTTHAVAVGDYYVTLFGSTGGGGHIELQLQ